MVTQKYKLDMIPNGQILNVHASQYDQGRVITFDLFKGTEQFIIPGGSTALITGTKPDKRGFSLPATIASGTNPHEVSVTLTQNMCAVPGQTICEIRLLRGDVNIGTANFILLVERAGLADDVDISETELPAYIDAAQSAAEQAAQSATEAAGSATSAASSATSASGSATAAAGSATNAANSAQAAAASVAQGTQVRFYMSNGHLFVVQTIGGVEQQPQDLGEVGGGTSFTEETYVSIASSISVIGSLPLSVYYGRMHRYGRDTYLEICLKTTDEWTFTSSSFGVVQITDSDGKLMPFWLDSQHQCVYQCGCASFNGAPLFIARMFYWDATHSTVVLEPSEGRTVSANVKIYLSLHFTNKYDE